MTPEEIDVKARQIVGCIFMSWRYQDLGLLELAEDWKAAAFRMLREARNS